MMEILDSSIELGELNVTVESIFCGAADAPSATLDAGLTTAVGLGKTEDLSPVKGRVRGAVNALHPVDTAKAATKLLLNRTMVAGVGLLSFCFY